MENKNNIFAPPSEDEINMFSAPSAEELDMFAPPSEDEMSFFSSSKPRMSKSQAALEGVKSGATLGFSDELAGATQGGLDKLQALLSTYTGLKSPTEINRELAEQGFTGDIGPTSSSEMYSESRDEARAIEKMAQKQNPGAYMTGNFAGGTLLPAGMFGKLAKSAAPLSQKIKSGIKVGAIGGGITGVGYSEEESLPGIAKDTAYGTLSGSLVGGSLPVGIKVGGDVLKESAGLVRDIGQFFLGRPDLSFKQGMQGLPLFGREAIESLGKSVSETGKEIGETLINRGKRLAKLKSRLIERAEKRGIKLDQSKLDDFLKKYEDIEVGSNLDKAGREAQELQDLIESALKGKKIKQQVSEVIPSQKIDEVRQFRQAKLTENKLLQSGIDPKDIDTVFELTDDANKMVAVTRQMTRDPETGNPLGYKKLGSKIIDVGDLDPTIKAKMVETRAGGRDLSSVKQAEQLRKDLNLKSQLGDEAYKTPEVAKTASQAATELRDMLRDKIPALKPTDEAIANLNKATEILGVDVKDADPYKIMGKFIQLVQAETSDSVTSSKFRQLGNDFIDALRRGDPKNADKIGGQLEELAQRSEVRDILGQTPGMLNWIQAMRLVATSAAGVAGRVAGIGVRAVRDLAKVTPESLRIMAQKAEQAGDKVGQRLAQELQKSASVDAKGRAAVLFSIMQNPEYRSRIKELQGKDSGRENTK